MRLLVPHLLAARGLIDRCDLWINTDNPDDLEYLAKITRQYPDYFFSIASPTKMIGLDAVSFFYNTDYRVPGTVYLKIDDDIVWMDPAAIRTLIDFRVRNREYFLVSANVWNNQLCDHIHQRCGLIPPLPFIEWKGDGSCWGNGKASEAILRMLIAAVEAGPDDRWFKAFERYVVRGGERLSINMVAWLGEDMASLGDFGIGRSFPGGDEDFFSSGALIKLGKDNVICGGALAAHFAFGPQRAHMDGTDLLEKWARYAPSVDRLTPTADLE